MSICNTLRSIVGLEPKYYWYCMSFRYETSSSYIHASTYSGHRKKIVTVADIEKSREYVDIDPKAVVVSISYMGRMTRSKLTNGAVHLNE